MYSSPSRSYQPRPAPVQHMSTYLPAKPLMHQTESYRQAFRQRNYLHSMSAPRIAQRPDLRAHSDRVLHQRHSIGPTYRVQKREFSHWKVPVKPFPLSRQRPAPSQQQSIPRSASFNEAVYSERRRSSQAMPLTQSIQDSRNIKYNRRHSDGDLLMSHKRKYMEEDEEENVLFDDDAFEELLGKGSKSSSRPSSPAPTHLFHLDVENVVPPPKENNVLISVARVELNTQLDPLVTPMKDLKRASIRLHHSAQPKNKAMLENSRLRSAQSAPPKKVAALTPAGNAKVKNLTKELSVKTPRKRIKVSNILSAGPASALKFNWEPVVQSPLRHEVLTSDDSSELEETSADGEKKTNEDLPDQEEVGEELDSLDSEEQKSTGFQISLTAEELDDDTTETLDEISSNQENPFEVDQASLDPATVAPYFSCEEDVDTDAETVRVDRHHKRTPLKELALDTDKDEESLEAFGDQETDEDNAEPLTPVNQMIKTLPFQSDQELKDNGMIEENNETPKGPKEQNKDDLTEASLETPTLDKRSSTKDQLVEEHVPDVVEGDVPSPILCAYEQPETTDLEALDALFEESEIPKGEETLTLSSNTGKPPVTEQEDPKPQEDHEISEELEKESREEQEEEMSFEDQCKEKVSDDSELDMHLNADPVTRESDIMEMSELPQESEEIAVSANQENILNETTQEEEEREIMVEEVPQEAEDYYDDSDSLLFEDDEDVKCRPLRRDERDKLTFDEFIRFEEATSHDMDKENSAPLEKESSAASSWWAIYSDQPGPLSFKIDTSYVDNSEDEPLSPTF